jgi:hypothetical protein
MSKINQPTQGREVDQNAGLGQQRVDEPGPGADETALPPSAGGPGTGGGDDAIVQSESSVADRRVAKDWPNGH